MAPRGRSSSLTLGIPGRGAAFRVLKISAVRVYIEWGGARRATLLPPRFHIPDISPAVRHLFATKHAAGRAPRTKGDW